MKNIVKTLLAGLLLLPAFSMRASAQQDKYAQLANELIEAGAEFQGKKIAVIPFSYADNRTGATKDGAVISERLTMKLINKRKFEIVERAMLDKVMGELKLQSSGIMDANSTQQLGKLLGVQAIITGTMIETSNGQIEVNARLIKTETAQAVGASQVTVEKNWIGDAASPQQPRQTYAQPQYQEAQQPEYEPAQQEYAPQYAPKQRRNYVAKKKGENAYGFFDIFIGFGSPKMDLEFYNSEGNIYPYELNMNGAGAWETTAQYTSIEAKNVQMDGFGPFVMRVGGFGNANIGGAFEFGYEKKHLSATKIDWSFDYGNPITFSPYTEDWLSISSFYMGGDLLIRFTKKSPVEPYVGIGCGFSLNSITMPNVWSYTNSAWSTPTEDFALGFVLNMPVGLRFKVGDTMQLLAEARYQLNTMSFDRGITSERDVLTLKGMYFNVGMGFTF
ncbi:MAG TPA: hypothetical protein DCZ92_11435 [Elusimicrobia bacterium]|nr:MAG: hypothetical protein A2016_05915 [Elusimicrobia bacterium GWF2_62_30]HBA61405.1 hypothetical protein [Elusimicrobiota bacterium]